MNSYWDGTKYVWQWQPVINYPLYYYPDNNQQVIAQLLKRIADLEAKLDAKQP